MTTALRELVERARVASPNERIDFRDPIAGFGADAVDAMAEWLADPILTRFAVRTLGKIAELSAREAAVDVLQLAREEATPQQLADIDAELRRLGVKTPVRRARHSGFGHVSHAPGWMMRTDRSKASWVWAEATAGRLRQGWGYQPKQDLNLLRDRRERGDPFDRHDDLAWPNRRMLDDEPDGMQIGDLVLLPHLPVEWHWALVRTTGPYRYEIDPVQGDYGHILPAAVVLADLTDAALTDELRRMRTYPARLRRLSDEAYRDLQSVVASVSDR